MKFLSFPLIVFLFATLFPFSAQSDVVRPALVEISANAKGHVDIEIRASIEALLTGINAKYKNTQDSPMAEAYDALRVLPGPDLTKRFQEFHGEFLDQIELSLDGEKVELEIARVDIPEPGYTKVPRMSLIILTTKIDRSASSLQWYYPARFGDNAVRVRQVDEANELWHWSEWQWIREDVPSEAFSLTEIFTKRSLGQTVVAYVISGFEHILPMGLDHILFIIGIFLFSRHMKPLLWQVTMFTVAHTITLGLAVSGYIDLPPRIVEPLIALSIAYVGIENIWHRRLHQSRLALIFAFGLLHGMGFASVLQEFGMPEDAFLTALISFNIGVEIGQLAVILAMYLFISRWFRSEERYFQWVVKPGSIIIAITGLYWTVDRVLG